MFHEFRKMFVNYLPSDLFPQSLHWIDRTQPVIDNPGDGDIRPEDFLLLPKTGIVTRGALNINDKEN